MQKLKSALAASLFSLCVAACSGVKHYALDQPADTAPQLRIQRVSISDVDTRIHFLYENNRTRPRRVGVHPPGHAGAFSLQSPDRSRSLKLTGVHGVAVLPERTLVGREGSVGFNLTFERIPDDWASFGLAEGKDAAAGETSWRFSKVTIR